MQHSSAGGNSFVRQHPFGLSVLRLPAHHRIAPKCHSLSPRGPCVLRRRHAGVAFPSPVSIRQNLWKSSKQWEAQMCLQETEDGTAFVSSAPSPSLLSLTGWSSRRPQAALAGALRISCSGAAYRGRSASSFKSCATPPKPCQVNCPSCGGQRPAWLRGRPPAHTIALEVVTPSLSLGTILAKALASGHKIQNTVTLAWHTACLPSA